MNKKEKTKEPTEIIMNCFQAMNFFKLNGRYRRIATMKFINETKTESEWRELFKTNKLLK